MHWRGWGMAIVTTRTNTCKKRDDYPRLLCAAQGWVMGVNSWLNCCHTNNTCLYSIPLLPVLMGQVWSQYILALRLWDAGHRGNRGCGRWIGVATCNHNRSNLQSRDFQTRIICNYKFISARINCKWTSIICKWTCNHPLEPELTENIESRKGSFSCPDSPSL